LDRLRENLETLDEQIGNARAMSKAEKETDSRTALQWTKTVRDLVELRNTTLEKIKAHILGRDETGAVNEPSDSYDDNHQQVMFERYFHGLLTPWTVKDLEVKCEDCGTLNDEVCSHQIWGQPDPKYPTLGIREKTNVDLCPGCYEKRPPAEKDHG
jgi:hypothetical protein